MTFVAISQRTGRYLGAARTNQVEAIKKYSKNTNKIKKVKYLNSNAYIFTGTSGKPVILIHKGHLNENHPSMAASKPLTRNFKVGPGAGFKQGQNRGIAFHSPFGSFYLPGSSSLRMGTLLRGANNR